MNLGYSSGLILHPTSLPGEFGVGEFGVEVVRWLDSMESMGQRIWQVLPLGPTGYGDSPYQSPSAFAGNPVLIGIELLLQQGLLADADLAPLHALATDRVDYEHLLPIKNTVLRQAARQFVKVGGLVNEAFLKFCSDEKFWLDDYAVFAAIKEREQGRPWWEWPDPWRGYSPMLVTWARQELAAAFEEKRVLQFFFHQQWRAMREEARRRGIVVLGDVPIFVAQDSAEVWSQQHLFQLDANGLPTVVAGVPPDYFSATGQRWGNPLYHWPVHERSHFGWWTQRMGKALELYDWVRVDHFRGFVDYWEIPASEPLATKGRWMPSPGRELFRALKSAFSDHLNVVAEDLGVLSAEVTALREEFGFPGMRILQFAFGTDPGAPQFLPETYVENCVAYTGTHDNDTVNGWFHDTGGSSLRTAGQCENERQYCLRHLGIPGREIHWELIEVLLRSKAGAAIFPVQDVLGLGPESRMNTPGTTFGNWCWRIRRDQLTPSIKERLRSLTDDAGRRPARPDENAALHPQPTVNTRPSS